jgi:hypothetical protein
MADEGCLQRQGKNGFLLLAFFSLLLCTTTEEEAAVSQPSFLFFFPLFSAQRMSCAPTAQSYLGGKRKVS